MNISELVEIIDDWKDYPETFVATAIMLHFEIAYETGLPCWLFCMIDKQRRKKWPASLIAEKIAKQLFK